jgi:hypothetical protein
MMGSLGHMPSGGRNLLGGELSAGGHSDNIAARKINR